MTANVRFLVSQKDNVVVIPNMAMRFRPPDKKDEAKNSCARKEAARRSRLERAERAAPPAPAVEGAACREIGA